jgi:hypothetical protein
MKFRHGAFQEKVSCVARGAGCVAVVGVSVAALAACGATGGRIVSESAAVPEFYGQLNRCLKKQGIANPEAVAKAANVERAIPALLGTEGVLVPSGVTKSHYEGALKRCGVTNVHVGRVPITNPVARRRIVAVNACLANNGFALPAADFSGRGPVLDTSAVDVASARWVATAMGCSVTSALTKAPLVVCMGTDALAGSATGANFEARLLALPACLKKRGL